MPAETLKEILEEAKRLGAKANWEGDLRRGRRALEILPRLVAVAEAAVEAERLTAIFQREYSTAPPDADTTAWTQRAWAASGAADDAIDKLFAVVRGSALASPAPGAGEEGE